MHVYNFRVVKEILLYSTISEWSAERFIKELQAAGSGGITIRVNSRGGGVLDGYGMIAKLAEYKGNKLVKVDGKAYSMAAMLLCYADKVECLDVSDIMFHRAAYASWVEESKDLFTDDMRKDLERTNQHLRAAMEAKIDVAKFEAITSVTLDQLFSMDGRIDVTITAEQAKEIGLVDKINKITPELKAELKGHRDMAIAALAEHNELPDIPEPEAETPPAPQPPKPQQETQKNKIMTIAELQANNPELYNQVVNVGVAQERDRVEALMVFADVDLEAIKKTIEDGGKLTEKQKAEFSRKAFSAAAVQKAEDENAPDIPTGPAAKPKTKAEQEAEGLNKFLDEELGEDK